MAEDRNNITEQEQQSLENIKQQEIDSVASVERREQLTLKNISAFEKQSKKTLQGEVLSAISLIKQVTRDSTRKIRAQEKKSVGGIRQETKKGEQRSKELFVSIQKKLTVNKQTGADTSTNQILKSILNELKIISKGSVKQDQQADKPVKEEKRKGFFSSIKSRFVAGKQAVGEQIQKASTVVKDAKENVGSLATNPAVIAGLLALVAPKEVLSFIKGFLGEVMFGEDQNEFVQGLTVFLGVLAAFKVADALSSLYKLIGNILNLGKMIFKATSNIAKIILNLGKFFFRNPAILLVIALVGSVSQLIKDFREKYGKRMERKGLEEDIVALKEQLKDPNLQPEQKKQIEEQIKQKEAQLEQFKKQGVFTTQGQARQAATKDFKLKDTEEQAVRAAVDYTVAVEKTNSKQQLTKDEQAIYDSYKTEKDPIQAIAKDFGVDVTLVKKVVEERIQQRKPTLEQKPPAATTAASTETQGVAPTSPANVAPKQDQQVTSSTTNVSNQLNGQIDIDQTQQAAPSIQPATLQQTIKADIGEQINRASTAIETAYDQKPADGVTATITANEPVMTKRANVISTIPGIFADRSAIAEYETFYTESAFAV